MGDRELLHAISELMDEKLNPLEKRMDRLEERITGVEARLEERIDRVEARLEEKITGVEARLEGEVSGLRTHLENVTDKNIQTIAEGHLDLNRKLDEALKIEQEKELLVIRVRVLEEDVQKIKERLGETA